MKNFHAFLLNKVVILVAVVLATGLFVAGGYLYIKSHVTSGVRNDILSSNSPVPSPSSSGFWKPDPKDVFIPPMPANNGVYANPIANTAVQWNSQSIKMNDQKLVLGYVDGQYPASQQDVSLIGYFTLGMHGENTIILATAPAVDPSGSAPIFFEKTPTGDYIFMQKMSTYAIYGYGSLGFGSDVNMPNADLGVGYALSSKVKTADTHTFYEGLVGITIINYQGLKLEQDYLSVTDLFSNYVTQQNVTGKVSFTKVATLAIGDLYLYQLPSPAPSDGINIDPVSFYIRRYVLRLPSGLYTSYNVVDDFIPPTYDPATITWNNATKNKYFFDPGAGLGGCGNPGSYVVATDDISQKIQPKGVTVSGETIYEFKNIQDPVLLYFYHYWGGKSYDGPQPQPVSIETWYGDHPVIVYKNPLGDYTILLNEKYGMTDGCGKPVIYLYPIQPTNVKVLVGADITQSEPLYSNGWKVLANPDGALKTADGSTYDSLFWEGIGHGNYPTIDKGFVVSQLELKTSLTSQLHDQGLNEKESTDFLNFWLPKMPTTPYVRLTWFTTQQMNQLAPLVVLPKPDTTIRIFLDFQGLENTISLPLQHLTSLPRKGFTVVEWGGLLRK